MTKTLRQSLFVTIVIASFASAAHAQTSTTLAWDEGSPSMVNGYAVTLDGVRKDYGLSPAANGACGCSVSLPISGGQHTIVVSAYNASGETASPPIVTAPVADAGGPYAGVVGTALAVSGSLSSAATGTIVTYQWTWGDGTTSSGSSPSASHTYATSGSFPITLKVTDNGGTTSSASTAATIAAASPSPVTMPSVSSVSPNSGATGVATSTTVAATFNKAMNASTLTTFTFTLRNSANTAIAATVAYDSSTLTATLTPGAALAAGTTYTATISGGAGGAADTSANALSSDFVWSFTTAALTPTPTTSCPCSLWTMSTRPGAEDPEVDTLELGMKFQSDIAGYITGVRFYKYAENTGTHVGNLWSSNGTLLGTVTFTNETSSGWQQAAFAKPIPISAKTTYVISYHTNSGRYASTQYGFSSSVNAGPLHGLASSGNNGNGVYSIGSRSAFPTLTWSSSNYWVDVVFTP